MNRTIDNFIEEATIARQAFQKDDQLQLVIMLDWLLQLASDVKEHTAKPKKGTE